MGKKHKKKGKDKNRDLEVTETMISIPEEIYKNEYLVNYDLVAVDQYQVATNVELQKNIINLKPTIGDCEAITFCIPKNKGDPYKMVFEGTERSACYHHHFEEEVA